MATMTVTRLQSGNREQRREKMADSKSKMQDKLNEIRSPLMERSNRVSQKKAAPIKPLDQKMAKPINKENIQPAVNKGDKMMTLSQSFLKTKTLKEKQLKGEKLKVDSMKIEKPVSKPVLGAYRGKIVQSKINSFRKPSAIASVKSVSTEHKATTQNTKPNVAASRRPPVALPTVNEKKRPLVPPKQVQLRASIGVFNKSKVDPLTTRRAMHNIAKVQIQTKVSTSMVTSSKAEPMSTRRTTHRVTNVTSHIKAAPSVLFKNQSQHVTVRRTTHVPNCKKALKGNTQQGPDAVNTAENKSPDSTALQSKKRVTIGPVSIVSSHQQTRPAQKLPVSSKYSRPSESAEERKARLAEWRASKGIVIKRPPLPGALVSAQKIQKEEPVIKNEPEDPKEETRRLFWVTMAEEDEQEVFTLKISQIFGECQKLIEEGIPGDQILSLLEKQVENIPEVKKLSRYWECLARLNQREGQLYKVIEVCEEAVAAGAQPLDELRTILADALEQLKTNSDKSQKENEEGVQNIEPKAEVKSELEQSAVTEKRKRGRRRAMKYELKSPTTPEKPFKSEHTPENGATASSVIRFNITTTPHLEKMRKLQMQEGESSIKGYKFLTPVRRSSRLERKVHTFPNMLKNHDPCIAGIAQLEELENPESHPNAYIFRKNEALKEISAGNLTNN